MSLPARANDLPFVNSCSFCQSHDSLRTLIGIDHNGQQNNDAKNDAMVPAGYLSAHNDTAGCFSCSAAIDKREHRALMALIALILASACVCLMATLIM
jgi:uncharacterized paraquat-inducible protein A